MEKLLDLTISDVSIKARSKKEVWTVLYVEGEVYLSPISNTNQKNLKEILTENKKYFLNKRILIKIIPKIENLIVKELISFAKQKLILNHIIQILIMTNNLKENGFVI